VTGQPYDAVVLAGGAGRRLGGVDKPALHVPGGSLLDLALEAVSRAGRVVVVGPPRELPAHVVQAREQPPGGGPGAALVTGLAHVRADRVVVLAADLPQVTAGLVEALHAAAAGHDGAMLVDDDGRDQVLTAVWSTAALRSALAGHDLAGRPLRPLLAGLDVARLPAAAAGVRGWADCDTPEDLARARGGAR
jgi:molybdopterin-guanine dinucleotide biosynthesis protein A